MPSPVADGKLAMNKWLGPGCRYALSAMIVLAGLVVTVEAKTFRWANDGDPTTMDPHARAATCSSPTFDMNMYEPLVRRDRNLKLEPALATEWADRQPDNLAVQAAPRRQVPRRHAVHRGGRRVLVRTAPLPRAPTSPSQLADGEGGQEDRRQHGRFHHRPGRSRSCRNYLAGRRDHEQGVVRGAQRDPRRRRLKDEENYATRNDNGTGPVHAEGPPARW